MSEKLKWYQPPGILDIEEEIKHLKKKLKRANKDLDKLLSESIVQCSSQVATGKGCGKMLQIGELEFIQTHYYIAPHGCTGGDYWLPGEGQFKCPHCGHINRLYATEDLQRLKHRFKSVKDVHREGDG